MSIFEIPLSPASQSFQITMNNVVYMLVVVWNGAANCWVLDINDGSGNGLIQGIPLITGVDLLAQYEYIGIDGQLFVQTDGAPDEVPTYANLGSAGHLYFVTGS